MSVRKTEIVMIGANIGYKNDDELYEKLEPYMKIGNKDIDCVFDGMNGNYVIIGKVINQGNEYDGMELKTISLTELIKIQSEVRQNIEKQLSISCVPELISVTHWS